MDEDAVVAVEAGVDPSDVDALVVRVDDSGSDLGSVVAADEDVVDWVVVDEAVVVVAIDFGSSSPHAAANNTTTAKRATM